MRLPHLALALSLLAPVAAAQIKNVPQPIEPGGEVHAEGSEQGSADEPSKTVDGKLLDAKAAAEAANMPRHARGMCHMVSAIHPNRIAPGTTGTGIVTMILEGDAVLTSPAPVQFTFAERQGPVTLAVGTFRPAKKARIAQAFAGREAYDNYAIFEVPLTVAAGTPHGRHQANLNLTFDLHHAQSGALLGKFTDNVTIDVEVGIPTSASNLMQVGGEAAGSAAGAGAAAASQAPATGSGATPVEAKPSEPIRPQVEANLPASEPAPAAVGEAPVAFDDVTLVEEGSGLPILMVAMIAGSLAVLVILMLVLRSKK